MKPGTTITQARIRRKKAEDGGNLPELAGGIEEFPGTKGSVIGPDLAGLERDANGEVASLNTTGGI